MLNVLLAVQYVSIAGLLFECSYISRFQKDALHGCLLFNAMATLETSVSYLAVMLSRTPEAAFIAHQLSYLGRVWIPFSLLRFVILLCNEKKVSRVVPLLALFHTVTYFVILSGTHHSLWFRSVGFEEDGIFPHQVSEYGIWSYLFYLVTFFYFVYMFVLLLMTRRKMLTWMQRKRIDYVTAAVFVDMLSVFLRMGGAGGEYDVTVLGYAVSTVFVYIAIFRYDLLETRELARDFVIDRLMEGIIAVNDKGQLGYVNSMAAELFPELRTVPENVIANLRMTIAAKDVLHIGGRIYQPEYGALYSKGKEIGTVFQISDRTEHYRYLEELEDQKLIAIRANAAKTEFLTSMSHEIRTPINAVLGLDEMILRDSREAAIRTYASDILSSGRMLLAIINDVLDFSKIEAGKMELLPVDYSLSTLVADLVNMIESRAYAKGLVFSVHVDKSMPLHLFGDDTRLKQCLLNLLTNAVKYTREGCVSMEIGYEKKDDSTIILRAEVRDTGIGIKPEAMELLCSPFMRFDEQRNRHIEGTGLGMSIVKSLLSAMGSTLEVKSEYGKGSSFSFAVEQGVKDWETVGDWHENTTRVSSSAAGYTESFQAPEAKILVVDDTPVNLTVFKGLLRKTRVQIDTASDGISGLEAMHRRPYHIIFIDHLMPNLDGLGTIAALRADDSCVNQNAVCVALTANAVSGARESYIAAGFSDYLSKPIDGGKLEGMIEHYLPAELVLHNGDEGFAVLKSGEWDGVERRMNGDSSTAGFCRDLFGLDIAQALKNCVTRQVFLESLKSFHEVIAEKADYIEKLAAEKDWKNYTIQVHALKSSARLIGADQLSELARNMEDCGTALVRAASDPAAVGSDDVAAAEASIVEKTPQLLVWYREYIAKLAPLCGGAAREELPPISPEMLRDALGALRELVAAADFAGADSVIAELDRHAMPADFEQRYAKIRAAVRAVDQTAAMELLAEANGAV
ncbi:MAG: response regulator [Treponema sp.]|nr:response regulator [Treponema sp.]